MLLKDYNKFDPKVVYIQKFVDEIEKDICGNLKSRNDIDYDKYLQYNKHHNLISKSTLSNKKN